MMPPSKKKRFNAFEDFPITEEKPVSNLSTISQEKSVSREVERIERLKPSEMMPDRFQPRRLLPMHIRTSFFSGEIDCYQAASEWIKFAQHDSGVKAEIDRLISLGNSFDEHGQIKAITGSWENDVNRNFVFRIETGERRFWAACLQISVNHIKEEPLLRVEVIDHPTRQRQVLENRHAESPSAVEQACEVAALILAELGISPDGKIQDDYEYFRLARSQRMPAGLWDRITPIMQLTRPRMVQLLNILQMPSQLLEMADRFRLSERVLREILNQPQRNWETLVHQSIQNSLTSEEIAEQNTTERSSSDNNKTNSPKTPSTPEKNANRSLRKFTRVFRNIDHLEQSEILDSVADDLFVSGQAENAAEILSELLSLIQARLKRR
jgi:hypothetical protein